MLVIHPKDRTTVMLSTLYKEQEHIIIDYDCGSNRLAHVLHHVPMGERIMLLGHGSDKGLYYRKNDMEEGFDRIIVGHPHAYHLRHHGSNIIGIWCHAVEFAKAEGLHGLFSGMIISEVGEAIEYGVMTDKQRMDLSNAIMFTRLRKLLDEGTPFQEVPTLMRKLDDEKSELTAFNYKSFYYL